MEKLVPDENKYEGKEKEKDDSSATKPSEVGSAAYFITA